MRVKRNQELLDEMPKFARDQLFESVQGRADTRKKVVRVHQKEAEEKGRQNAALPPDAWENMDDAVYSAEEDTLRIVQDLRDAGLTHSVSLDAKYDTWGIIEDTGEARVGMTPEAQTEESDVTVEDDGAPIPIIDDGFSIGFRERPTNNSRLPGSLDTTKATVAGRHVSEKTEELFVNSENIQITGVGGQGFTLYGMTDHPSTATGTTSADWTTDTTVIRDDFRGARYILKHDRKYSPGRNGYWVYLGSEYYDTLDDIDPDGSGDQTVRDRVEDLSNISRIEEADFLPEKSMLMFRPTQDVIEVGIGASMSNVQWENPFRDKWRVLASMYPRIKQTLPATNNVSGDYQNGILYWTA